MTRMASLCWGALTVLLLAGCSASKAEQDASALHFFKRGNLAMEEEDFGRAVRMYKQAAALDPRSPSIPFNLGLAYYRLESFPEAIKAYQQAIKADSTFADAHLNLALAFDRLYNIEAAQQHFNAYQRLARSQAAASAESSPKPQGSTPEKPPGPPRVLSGGKSGPPQPIGEIRRLGPGNNAGKTSQPSGGDGKWWTQDSTPRTR